MNIELRRVSKAYGGTRALDNVSLELAAGEILGVLGANGSGKTTLLRCLAGVVAPTDGTILFAEEPFCRGRQDLRRRLFYLPDFPFVFSEMSVARFIGMVLRVYEADRPGVEEQVLALLREFDLLPLSDRMLGHLSRGQVYKAALVANFAVDPELWLLDEPFASGMDPHGINAFKRRAEAAVTRGRTVIFTTQLLDIAERFATRICVLHKGEVRAFDSVAALREARQGPGGPLEEIFQQLREETA